MLKKLTNTKYLLATLLILVTISRLYRLDYPQVYVFDEVYHAVTAKAYLKGLPQAWQWWTKSETGLNYEWKHPPIAKELMTASMYIMGSTDGWAYRLPGALLGIWAVFLVYKIGITLFKNETVGLISAFAFSLDGLTFVQSRTGMNDIYLVTFILASLFFYLRKNFVLTVIFTGLAVSTKWTGIFLLMMYIGLLIKSRLYLKTIFMVLVSTIIYILSYLPFFMLGNNLIDLVNLHKQIWIYQTTLKATHTYASAWWLWPLNLKSVPFFIQNSPKTISSIYAIGNPAIFWAGLAAIILTFLEFTQKKAENLIFILLGYFIFLLPWAFSPRIMFLYHYSPSVPFLCLALGYQLNKLSDYPKGKQFIFIILALIFLVFLINFPILTALPLPKLQLDYLSRTQ